MIYNLLTKQLFRGSSGGSSTPSVPPAELQPVITLQPEIGLTVTAPTAFVLTVEATNAQSYQWRYASGDGAVPNGTSASLTVDPSVEGTWGYYCIATNVTLTAQTIDVFVTVNAAADTTAPTVTAFVIPATSDSYTIPVSTFTATDAVGVTGYLITESATPPLVGDAGWSGTAQTSYVVSSDATYTLYAWAKDAAGNISSSLNDSCIVVLAAPEVTGLFVDNTVASSATYDPATRTIGSGDQQSYTTVQAAVTAIAAGEDIWIRGAVGGGAETYAENVLVSGTNVPDGLVNNYCSLQSYPGEWAIINSDDTQAYGIGAYANGYSAANFVKYWKIERLEVTGSPTSRPGGYAGCGIMLNGGPNIIRYCYVHDYIGPDVGNNVAGIGGYGWVDNIVEYNYLADNGALAGTDGNAANIMLFADYNHVDIATNGYTPDVASPKRNIIRYNHSADSVYGFKHKSTQLFTGRNPGTADYVDTYSDYGDSIHHNYFKDARRGGLLMEQDFCQGYNNIFDTCREGINVQYQPGRQLYNVVSYNNTIVDPNYFGVCRWGDTYWAFSENEAHYGHDYNNLIDNCTSAGSGWTTTWDMNVLPNTTFATPDVSNYVCSNNYTYRTVNADVFRYNDTYYTPAEFEAQTETSTPRVHYSNAFDAGNLLYAGTTGADKFITEGTHLIETGVTVADGGVDIVHPYLSGVTIPAYMGAVNPSSTSWVDGVINDVSNVTWLIDQDPDSVPSWVE